MKTIAYQGVRYPVVTISSCGVVVQMPDSECWGMYSRKTIPFEQLTSRQQHLAFSDFLDSLVPKKNLKPW